MKPNATQILIADDHHLVADSLSTLLNTVEGFSVMGIVNNGWQALHFIEKNDTHIVLADCRMPLLNGIELTSKIREKEYSTKVIMLTMNEEAECIREAIQAGVYGYVMKSAEKNELVDAIKTVAKGEKYFSGTVVRKLAEIPNENSVNGKTQISDIHSLTPREMEIVKLVAEDLSNVEIGERLCISSTTVETHRRNLMKKIGVSTAVGIMKWGLKNGVLEGI